MYYTVPLSSQLCIMPSFTHCGQKQKQNYVTTICLFSMLGSIFLLVRTAALAINCLIYVQLNLHLYIIHKDSSESHVSM